MATMHKDPSSVTLDDLLEETKEEDQSFSHLLTNLSQDESAIEDDGLTEEQKQVLSMFRDEETAIQGSHPGRKILDDELYGCLFNENLSPLSCGVTTAGVGVFGLDGYQPDVLSDLLFSDIISITFESQPCKSEIQRWLLFVMSVHSNATVVKKCEELLQELLHWQLESVIQSKGDCTFSPSISDVTRIFLNWGVPKEEIMRDDSLVKLSPQDVEPLQVDANHGNNSRPCRNYRPVLKMLSHWLQAKPAADVNNSNELSQLLLMVCRLCLDPALCKEGIFYEIQVCVASVLQRFNVDALRETLPVLCKRVSELSDHHHDQVFVCRLFTHASPNARLVQQRLAYYLLHTAVMRRSPANRQIEGFEIVQLCPVLGELGKVEKNIYRMSSLVALLDMSVGTVVGQDQEQRKQLMLLLKEVRAFMSRLRDSVMHMDTTKVKGMLMHLCLKWDFVVKATSMRQRTIFNCFASPPHPQHKAPVFQKFHVERLQDKGSQDMELDSESQSGNPESVNPETQSVNSEAQGVNSDAPTVNPENPESPDGKQEPPGVNPESQSVNPESQSVKESVNPESPSVNPASTGVNPESQSVTQSL